LLVVSCWLGFGCWVFVFVWALGAFAEFFEEHSGETPAFGGFVVLGGWGQGAEGWVLSDLFYELCGFGAAVVGCCGGAGEVGGGDGEAVEEQAGSAWVEFVSG
jgi:hypothetical protein